jgi:integrase/recombinase XerC/integrase/recombinase XerD
MEHERDCSISEIDLDTITGSDLKAYVSMLRNKKKLENHPLKPTVDTHITKRSIRTYSIDLRTFFNFLYNNEYMEKNIIKNFKIIKSEDKLILPLSTDEVSKIDNLFNLKCYRGIRNYCAIHLMLDEGLRSGDVCNLRISCVDFDQNYIVIINGKGDKDRIVPLSRKLRQPLYKYICAFRPHTGTHDYLFCSFNDPESPLSEDAIKSLFSRIRKETDIKRLKPHLLRHTFATSYILYGGDIESLRLYLGHSSYSTTQNYLHLANLYEHMESDVYKLDDSFFRCYYSSKKCHNK